jgi:hypothetical protein
MKQSERRPWRHLAGLTYAVTLKMERPCIRIATALLASGPRVPAEEVMQKRRATHTMAPPPTVLRTE